MIVADTDVLIDFLAGRGEGAAAVARELERGDLVTTAITRFELLSGAKTTRQMRPVCQLLAALPTLSIDETIADAAAEIRRELERSGTGIGMADSLIAGTTIRNRGILLTRNRSHFERVRGLALADL